MNKKLFSWKALAGLALLVAMGLTSCKQGTEVDPNDPYNTQKPIQPGTSEKGTADLTFTITKAVQLKELWDKYDAAKKAELMKKTAITIDVNFKDFEIAAGETFVLQKYFNTVANSALTVRFNGNFKNADKQDLYLDLATNLTGALVNVVLPAQTFNLHLNCAGVRTNLTSGGATIGKLYTNADANKNNALSVNSGVTVKGIDDTATGAILVGGGAIEALIANTTKVAVNKKGFKIGSEDVYTSNLIVNAANLFVTTDKDTPLGAITINKNCDAIFTFSGTTAASVTGTAPGESKLTLTGKADDLKNIAALKNVNVVNGGTALDVKADIFDNVKISEDINVSATSLAGVEATGDVYINFTANNVTYAFSGLKVASTKAIRVKGGIEVTLTPSKTTYQWDIDKKIWVEVTGAAPISAANAGDTGVEVSSSDVSVSAAGALSDPNNKVGDHKVFTIVKGNKDYIQPEGCAVTLTKCTYAGAAIIDSNINSAIKYSGTVDPTWFYVKVDNDTYTWKKAGSASAYYWLLVK
jgi:hypothetical protein